MAYNERTINGYVLHWTNSNRIENNFLLPYFNTSIKNKVDINIQYYLEKTPKTKKYTNFILSFKYMLL